MEATSAMMMAVEQFVLGHHDDIQAHEAKVRMLHSIHVAVVARSLIRSTCTQALQYKRYLDGLIGQKRFLLRTMQLYEGM